MSLSIFDFFVNLFGLGWKFLCFIADMSIRFFTALLNFGTKAACAVLNLFFAPFTHGLSLLTDWTALDLRGLFSLVMWVLLGACALLALFALGSNMYRRYRHRL